MQVSKWTLLQQSLTRDPVVPSSWWSSSFITCPNIDEFLPVTLEYWKQYIPWGGTYTPGDLLEIAEWAEVRRKKRRKGGRSRPRNIGETHSC
jgi:hypothetical protein